MSSIPIITIIKAGLSNQEVRKALGWILVAILSPLILLVAFFCCLGSGAANQNVSTVDLCFRGGLIPAQAPQEYRSAVEAMRGDLARLDGAIIYTNSQMENGSRLDSDRVKSVYYAMCFGTGLSWDAQQFVDCFVTYEERVRQAASPAPPPSVSPSVPVTSAGPAPTAEPPAEPPAEPSVSPPPSAAPSPSSSPPPVQMETYLVAVPVEDLTLVYQRLESVTGTAISPEVQANADKVYQLVHPGGAPT